MRENELDVGYARETRHDVDEQRLLDSRRRVLAKLLLERHLWREVAKDAMGKAGDLQVERERLGAELDDMVESLPGVDCVRPIALNWDRNGLVAADKLFRQGITRFAAHRRLGEEGGNLGFEIVHLRYRSHLVEVGALVEDETLGKSCRQCHLCILMGGAWHGDNIPMSARNEDGRGHRLPVGSCSLAAQVPSIL